MSMRKSSGSSNSSSKTPKRREKSSGSGSTFIGILIGLVLGLMIALGVAWYINKLPNPFVEKSPAPKAATPATPAPAPKVAASAETPKPAAQEPVTKSGTAATTAETLSSDKKSTPAARETFFVQTGSFQNAQEADTLKARLALLGLEATVQTRNLPDKGVWHRVRIGPYTDIEELNRVRGILKQNDIEAALVKVRDAE